MAEIATLTTKPMVKSVTTVPKAARRWPLPVLLSLVAALYLASSFAPVIFDETEGQYAGAAREMLRSGQWLVPTNDGIPRLQKPPLLYWFLCLSLKTFGPTEFAARLPNALATIGWIWAVYLIGERVRGRRLGLATAGIFASMMGLFVFSHLIMPEPLLGLLISLTFWCFLSAYRQPQHARRWFLGAWLFMGLGVIAKGLHGALYPLLAALLSGLAHPKARPFWRGLWSPAGGALLVAVAVPWYAAIAGLFPGFLTDHFVNEQLGHLFDHRVPRDADPVPFGIFWAEHLLFFFPWTLFVPAAIWSWRKQNDCAVTDRAPQRMVWIWILLTAASIAVSTRQDHYTMTTWGAVAVWLALPWASDRRLPRGYLVLPCMILAAIGGTVALWAQFSSDPAWRSPIVVTPVVARGDLFKSVSGFSFGAWRECMALMKATGIALLLGGAAAGVMAFRNKKVMAGIVLGLAMAFCFGMVARGYSLMASYFSLADAARTINQRAAAQAVVVCEGEPHVNSSLFFYLDRPVHWIGARRDNEFATRALHIGADLYLTDAEFAAWWHSPRQVFLITEGANLPKWQAQLGLEPSQALPCARSGTRVVIVNEPAPKDRKWEYDAVLSFSALRPSQVP